MITLCKINSSLINKDVLQCFFLCVQALNYTLSLDRCYLGRNAQVQPTEFLSGLALAGSMDSTTSSTSLPSFGGIAVLMTTVFYPNTVVISTVNTKHCLDLLIFFPAVVEHLKVEMRGEAVANGEG